MTSKNQTFNLWQIIIFVAVMLFAISGLNNWYAQHITLPRYCENPEQTLSRLQKILESERPAGSETRRPYLIVAKILFLLPRQADETIEAYLERVRYYLQEQCLISKT